MRELVPMNDYGIFVSAKYEAMVDSRFVAEIFDKQHKHVLRDIEKTTESGLSEAFGELPLLIEVAVVHQ